MTDISLLGKRKIRGSYGGRQVYSVLPGINRQAGRKAVDDYLNGGDWQLVAEFTEIESGKKNDRPELAEALTVCKKEKATRCTSSFLLSSCLA